MIVHREGTRYADKRRSTRLNIKGKWNRGGGNEKGNEDDEVSYLFALSSSGSCIARGGVLEYWSHMLCHHAGTEIETAGET